MQALKNLWPERVFLSEKNQELLSWAISGIPMPVVELSKLIDVQKEMICNITNRCSDLAKIGGLDKVIFLNPMGKDKSCGEMRLYLEDLQVKAREQWSIVNAFLHDVILLANV